MVDVFGYNYQLFVDAFDRLLAALPLALTRRRTAAFRAAPHDAACQQEQEQTRRHRPVRTRPAAVGCPSLVARHASDEDVFRFFNVFWGEVFSLTGPFQKCQHTVCYHQSRA